MLLKKYFYKNKRKVVEANVVDEDYGWPIAGVRVFVINCENNKIVAKTYTDKLGSFRINMPKVDNVKFVVFKKSWEEIRELCYSKKALSMGDVRIEMRKINENILKKSFGTLLLSLTERLFEVFLLTTIVFEILFVSKFGVLRVVPFY